MTLLLAAAVLAATPVNWDTLGGVDWDTLNGPVVLSPQPAPQPIQQPRLTPVDYPTAYRRYFSGEEMLVFLTADWCGPCQQAKQLYERQLAARGALVYIDIDREPILSREILGLPPGTNFTIPRVVRFRNGMRSVFDSTMIRQLAEVAPRNSQ